MLRREQVHAMDAGRFRGWRGAGALLGCAALGCVQHAACGSDAGASAGDAGPVVVDAGPPLPDTYRTCTTDTRDPERGFCDVTARWGVQERFQAPPERAEEGAKGVLSVADFDGDGRPDVYASLGTGLLPVLVLNRGGHFERAPSTWNLVPLRDTEGSAAADLDGDGDPDLVVGRGGSSAAEVYRNDGDRFTRAADLPLGRQGMVETLVPADLDGDGRLDLLVGAYRFDGPCTTPLPGGDCAGGVFAYRQTGTLQFEPVPVTLTPRRVQGMRLFDWDDDGHDEVLVSSDFGMFDGANAVLRIDRSGGSLALRDASAGTGFDLAMFGMGVATIDADGDGRDEVLVSNIGRQVLFQRTAGHGRDVAAALGADAYGMVIAGMRPTFRALDPGNALEGPIGVFRDAYLDARSPLFPTVKWPPVVFDHDDDGIDDVFLPASITGVALLPLAPSEQSTLLRGTGARFEDATRAAALGNRHDARVAAAADFDADGDLDLVLLETSVHGVDGGLRFLRNDVSDGRSLTVVVHGRAPATDGIGATVEVRVGARTLRRRIDGNLSLFGSGPHEAHFGLGAAAQADAVTVRFADGTMQQRTAVPMGRLVVTQ